MLNAGRTTIKSTSIIVNCGIVILPSCHLRRSAASATVRSACLHHAALTLILSRHPALHVSESAAAQPSWAWPPPTATDRRLGVLCHSMYTCCVVCVSCMGVRMYACTCHVSAMIACGTAATIPSIPREQQGQALANRRAGMRRPSNNR